MASTSVYISHFEDGINVLYVHNYVLWHTQKCSHTSLVFIYDAHILFGIVYNELCPDFQVVFLPQAQARADFDSQCVWQDYQ